MKKPRKRSLTELADAAFEQATTKVIERAVQAGTPLILWVNGEVKEVDPQAFLDARKRGRRRKATG